MISVYPECKRVLQSWELSALNCFNEEKGEGSPECKRVLQSWELSALNCGLVKYHLGLDPRFLLRFHLGPPD